MSIEACRKDEQPSLIALLDEEFIFKRGRTLSLSERFPSLFHVSNLPNIHVLRLDGAIRASLVVKHFDWYAGVERWKGAMIGLVHTDPTCRGKGLASEMLRSLESKFQSDGIDFGVLFTTIHEFYERLGWKIADRGVFGEVRSGVPALSKASVSPRALTEGDSSWIECFRKETCGEFIPRTMLDYRTVPLPAIEMECFQSSRGYAIVGKTGSTGYLQELVVKNGAFSELWPSIISSYESIFVNDRQESSLFRWLEKNQPVSWKAQRQTMWRAFSKKASTRGMDEWYIPYFDRI